MTIGIIGLGLIGGSIAKALKHKTGHRVLGTDIQKSVLCKARMMGAIDEELSLENAGACDMLFIALYPASTLQALAEYAPHLKPGTVVLDTCGVKQVVCPSAEAEAKTHGLLFIGAHPMAGRECEGFEAALVDLFDGASMILTPHEVPLETLAQVKQLCLDMGFGRVVLTTPEHHDAMIAYTSQLAHVVSSAYVQSPLAAEHAGYSAGSFADMTRVAHINVSMWTELFLDNKEALAKEIGGLIGRLERFQKAILEEDRQAVASMLEAGDAMKKKADKAEAAR
jgi:prephenate dehydrogenase